MTIYIAHALLLSSEGGGDAETGPQCGPSKDMPTKHLLPASGDALTARLKDFLFHPTIKC